MPGFFKSKRRYFRRRPRKGRKAMGRTRIKYLPTRVRPNTGGFTLVRKLPLITFASAALAGAYVANDPTGTCLTLGVPTLSPGTSNQYDVPFSLKFQLNQLTNFNEITNISDAYKINSVIVRLSSGFQVATGLGAAVPFVEYYQDHDDAGLPTLSALRQRMSTKTKYFGPVTNMIKMGVRPRTADEIYNNGITTAYGVNKPQWINCDYPAAEHYGIKGIIHNWTSNGTPNQALMTFDISVSVSAKDIQ